ncbi:MAG: hypothetical protein GY886_01605 [Gammaproteobacteria bacterium]|nr:hypothetical protein [Gammaproteobacteria bacterium]
MTLRLGGDGAITGCTSLENPDLTVSGLTISGSFDAEKVLVASGTAAAPSYTFSGDTDNGLYYAGTNSIGLSTAGTNAILIDSTGNVGIGTTSPVDSTNYVNLALSDSSGGIVTFMQGATQSADIIGGSGLYLRTLDASPITFRTNGSNERMRIDSSGNVGIGTTSPSRPFNVSGSGNIYAAITSTSANNAGLLFGDSSDDDAGYLLYANSVDALLFGTAAGERMRIDSAGRVGIGNSNPGDYSTVAKDLVVGNHSGARGITIAAQSNNTGYLSWADGTSTVAEQRAGRIAYSHADNSMRFDTDASERMRIDSSGNASIGTSAPPYSLSADELRLSVGDSLNHAVLQLYSHSSKWGSIAFNDNSTNASNAGLIGYYHPSNYMVLNVNNAERMRIRSDGYVNAGNVFNVAQHRFNGINATAGTHIFTVSAYQTSGGSSQDSLLVYACDSGGVNNAAAAVKAQRISSTGRSFNAAGTINASGSDYAEYMTKAGNFTLAKGDICGVDSEGKLTNMFNNAISFVVKSTDPSYVGGDSWHKAIGEEPGGYNDDRTEEEIAAAKIVYQEALEAARQGVDRIAFSGQVPVNVTDATAGQYIIPVATNDGGIVGMAKNEADLTFAEYMQAVGKVIAIEDDGRARIIVKVA